MAGVATGVTVAIELHRAARRSLFIDLGSDFQRDTRAGICGRALSPGGAAIRGVVWRTDHQGSDFCLSPRDAAGTGLRSGAAAASDTEAIRRNGDTHDGLQHGGGAVRDFRAASGASLEVCAARGAGDGNRYGRGNRCESVYRTITPTDCRSECWERRASR